jgi:hypothetical protein
MPVMQKVNGENASTILSTRKSNGNDLPFLVTPFASNRLNDQTIQRLQEASFFSLSNL